MRGVEGISVYEVAYHRNGVSGAPFYAIRFREFIEGKARHFCASVFEEAGYVSVVCLDMIEAHGVDSAWNAWRGDYYEPHLRAAIEAHRLAQGMAPASPLVDPPEPTPRRARVVG